MTATLAAALLAAAAPAPMQHLGADLSFANEMEDCGAVFREAGKPVDPFVLTRAHGGNLVRVRLWNSPGWTRYSTYDDALKTIRRAHAAGMEVLLDFHYADDWADGNHQPPPAAWAGLDAAGQARALHDFTRDTLDALAAAGQLPEWVQVGNETNPEMLRDARPGEKPERPIDWARNARLLNAGIAAVREAAKAHGRSIGVMLHIAQPENVIGWFDAAVAANVIDFDVIGISYYPKWSKYNLSGLGKVIDAAHRRYGAQVWVVETAYPFTTDYADTTTNLLGTDSTVPGYPITPQGQLRFMQDLVRTVVANGGNGVVYWAPDRVSTRCKTRWGVGSDWENATWFDIRSHEALPVVQFMARDPARP